MGELMGKRILQVIGKAHILSPICFLLVSLVGMMTAGCGKPHVYMHPSPGLDRIKKVAVMPFDNMAKEDKAGERIRVGFVLELLRTGSLSVIDINETDRLLKEAGISYTEGQMLSAPAGVRGPRTEAGAEPGAKAGEGVVDSTPISKRIGAALNVEAIVAGSVQAYNTEKTGTQTRPEVSITAKLIDAETGLIIWMGTHNKRGGSGIPILGWGKVTSLSALSQQVIQDMVDSLAEYMP